MYIRRMSRMFGDLFQLGHVVTDLDDAVGEWISAGVGPWEVIRDFPVDGWWHDGEPTDPHVDVALAWSGDTQIELICQTNDAPSMYRDFLRDRPEGGFQHVGYRCPDYDAAVEAGRQAGYTMWMHGLVSGRPFGYLKPPPGSGTPVVEVSQSSEQALLRARLASAAARAWDGTAPRRERP